MRALFSEIGIKVAEDKVLDEIVSLEERKKLHTEYLAEKERKQEELRLAREK